MILTHLTNFDCISCDKILESVEVLNITLPYRFTLTYDTKDEILQSSIELSCNFCDVSDFSVMPPHHIFFHEICHSILTSSLNTNKDCSDSDFPCRFDELTSQELMKPNVFLFMRH